MDDLELRAQTRIGRVLNDKWRLESLLGIGGMASVYAARHRNGAKAALKLLHPELAADQTVRQRFLAEGYAANKVEHPNAVQVLDDDVLASGSAGDEGTAYLVMELLQGESLLAYARRLGRTLHEEEVLEIADGVLDVLAAAHAHGIVHRDLKPENLFLVKPTSMSGTFSPLAAALKEWTHVKVLDFGIARIADSGGKTRVGTTLGTPSYMAPEQAQGRRDAIDGRTDLFALGATMWRLLLGQRIHDGPSAAEILAKMATAPAPPVRSVGPQLSERTAAIIDRAVQFHRDERYPDAATMRADVRAALANQPLPYAPAAPPHEEPTVPEGRGASAAVTFEAGGGEATAVPAHARFPSSPAAVTVPNLGVPQAQVEPTPRPPMTAEVPRTDAHVAPAALPPTRAYPPVARPSRMPKVLLWIGLALLPIAALALFLLLRAGDGGSAEPTDEAPSSAKPPGGKAEAVPSSDDPESDDPESDEPASAAKPSASHGELGSHGAAAPLVKPTSPAKKKPAAPKAPPPANTIAIPTATQGSAKVGAP